MQIKYANGEGQSQCRLCKLKGKNNVQWCCFMYEIEGYEGHYCEDCMKDIICSNFIRKVMERKYRNEYFETDRS